MLRDSEVVLFWDHVPSVGILNVLKFTVYLYLHLI